MLTGSETGVGSCVEIDHYAESFSVIIIFNFSRFVVDKFCFYVVFTFENVDCTFISRPVEIAFLIFFSCHVTNNSYIDWLAHKKEKPKASVVYVTMGSF